MIRYPNDYNPILEYWEKIKSGKIPVSKKIYKTYSKLVDDLADSSSEFFYCTKRANHAIEFIENYCRHSKGKFGGQPIRLELWEKAMLAAIFGFIDNDGNRKYREAILIVGKKNGKSLLASAIGLYLMVGDNEAGAEVYAVASMRDQAKIIWNEAKRMVNKSPSLKKRIKTRLLDMESSFNDGIFKPLASDSDTLDGLNIHGALMDEVHQWKHGRALYDIIADGVTAREQPLILITTTAGTIREDIFDEKYEEAERLINGYGDSEGYHDERLIAFIYELDSRDEWTKPECWLKANPGLGTIKNEKTLAEKVERAKANPNLVKNLVCKEFNIRETTSEAWLTAEQIENRATFDIDQLKPRYAIGGVDLSKTTDLTCASILFRVPGFEEIFVDEMFWLPESCLEKRIAEDKIPYDKWYDRGLLRLCEGNVINYHDITAWFLEIQQEKDIYIHSVGYDSWSAPYWVQEMEETFGKIMIPVIQGKKTLSDPMHKLEADLENKIINYNNNPITKWCLFNTSVDVDKNGNIQPCKTHSKRKRIDGTAAMLDSYVAYLWNKEEYETML